MIMSAGVSSFSIMKMGALRALLLSFARACLCVGCVAAWFATARRLRNVVAFFRWAPKLLEDFVLRYSDICRE
jgi:hypothetical protein